MIFRDRLAEFSTRSIACRRLMRGCSASSLSGGLASGCAGSNKDAPAPNATSRTSAWEGLVMRKWLLAWAGGWAVTCGGPAARAADDPEPAKPPAALTRLVGKEAVSDGLCARKAFRAANGRTFQRSQASL